MASIGAMSLDDWASMVGHSLLNGDVKAQVRAYKIINSIRSSRGQSPLTYNPVEAPKKQVVPQPEVEEEEPQEDIEDDAPEVEEEEEPAPRPRGRPPQPQAREPPKLVQKKQQYARPPLEEE